jgi:hypothetical protein
MNSGGSDLRRPDDIFLNGLPGYFFIIVKKVINMMNFFQQIYIIYQQVRML